jgi:hypothetical protein
VPSSAESRRSRCFGLTLEFDEDLPELPAAPAGDGGAVTTVARTSAADIAARWGDEPSEIVSRFPVPERPDTAIRFRADLGYLIAPEPFGRHLVGADGGWVLSSAETDDERARWRRLLVGQVLPLAAALRGFEILHASAVLVGDRLIAFSGPPGAGKSTLALHLALQGYGVFAEDALAVEPTADGLVAHPGVALLNLRADDDDEDARAAVALGVELGRTEKLHVLLERQGEARPLDALYLLEPAADQTTIERIPAPTLRHLFDTLFVAYLTAPAHLIRHMDAAAALVGSVPIHRVGVDLRSGARALAEQVADHAAHALGGSPA